MKKQPRPQVQVQLRSGTARRTCWVEPVVKAGDQVTLANSDEPDRLWKVIRVSAERDASTLHTDWDPDI